MGADASGQLPHRERLDEVVHCAAIKPSDPILDLPARGEHDHRQFGTLSVNTAQHVHPAQPRQHQVEDHQVDVGFQRTVEPGLAVARGGHIEPLAPKAPLDEVDDPRLVLNHQDHGGDHRFGSGQRFPCRRLRDFSNSPVRASLAGFMRLGSWLWLTPSTRRGRASPAAGRFWRLFGGGTDGNEQLTAIAAVILLVLFAVLGITIVRIGQLLWLHLFLGVLLVGPVALKLASTGYRFARYYSANPAYRRKGPPHPLMRMLGPFVILSTLAVFFTGLLLLIDGPGAPSMLRLLHKLSFFAWLAVVGVHVLGHLVEMPAALRAVSRSERRRHNLPGSRGRGVAVFAALAGGLVLALLFLPEIHNWTAGGLHHFHDLRFHQN